ncbi:hypothetical protein, partial [Escherichia coli]|uniref:hypothetical protein n=1 Tax=Escherichia coli TaxID=562 RepID=UPI001A7E08B8
MSFAHQPAHSPQRKEHCAAPFTNSARSAGSVRLPVVQTKKPARRRALLTLPSRTKSAKYQIFTKYMPFNLLLQHFALKMPPFVLNA